MAIIIGWKVEEGRKWPERLDIDPDHLDADEIKNLKETKQWFPDVKEFMHWVVKCSLEERDNGDREIVVKYRDQQDDENLLSYRKQHGSRYFFGKKQDYCRARSENRSNAPDLLGIGFAWDDLEVGYRFRTVGRTVTEADLANFISITGMMTCQVRHEFA